MNVVDTPGQFVPPPMEDDPLPRRRLIAMSDGSGPIGGAVIKERPSDFLVDELPLYELSGEGEHLYLGVQKQSMAHSEMMDLLARHFAVREDAIGFAGMKDRVAVTRQAVSIHLPGRPDPEQLPQHERLQVLWAQRHGNKLRRGHLAGNRFAIRVRRVEPTKAPQIWRAIKILERDGIPDYFGAQRFGYRRNTHRLGRHLLRQDWTSLVDELLGVRSPFPEHQRPQRELAAQSAWQESLPLWGRNDRAERIVLGALARGRSAAQAVKSVPPYTRSFWVSAFQSAVFNRLLDERIDRGLVATLIEGDIAVRGAGRGQFRVTKEELENPELAQRIASFELSPSGPMLGPGMTQAGEPVATWETTATVALGVPPEYLLASTSHAEGARRPFRVAVSNIELDAGFDEFGTYVRLAFDLPRGAYATVLLREIFGDGAATDDEPRD